VAVQLRLRGLRLLDVPFGNVPALGDQVDEAAEEGQEDDENRPGRLPPAADVMAAEEIAEDGEQEPEEQDPGEEDEQRPHHLAERVVRGYHALPP
jgi:hypothetical protein